MRIETDRLILRPIVPEDDRDIYEYAKSPNVGPNAGWKPHDNIEETREIMRTIFLDKEGIYGIGLKESSKILGTIGFMDDPKRQNDRIKMLGYALGDKYWGLGIIQEAADVLIPYAFDKWDIDFISAYCYPENKRSKRVLEKCGFVYEATLKSCEKLYNGIIMDNDCYIFEPMRGFSAVADHVNFSAKKLFSGGRRIKDGAIAVMKEGGGGPVSAHVHEHDHLFVVTAGEARIEIEGETFIVRENESFLVQGSKLHSVWNNKEAKTVMFGISLEKE